MRKGIIYESCAIAEKHWRDKNGSLLLSFSKAGTRYWIREKDQKESWDAFSVFIFQAA